MKPRPPPNQIVPAETTHYCKPCFRSIGGVWWETKLRLVKFFVVLFEGTSESPTNQTDRGVDTSDCPISSADYWVVGASPARVMCSSIHQEPKLKCIHFSAGLATLRNFFLFFPLDKCRKVCYNQRAQDDSQGPNFRSSHPICKIFCTSSTSHIAQ